MQGPCTKHTKDRCKRHQTRNMPYYIYIYLYTHIRICIYTSGGRDASKDSEAGGYKIHPKKEGNTYASLPSNRPSFLPFLPFLFPFFLSLLFLSFPSFFQSVTILISFILAFFLPVHELFRCLITPSFIYFCTLSVCSYICLPSCLIFLCFCLSLLLSVLLPFLSVFLYLFISVFPFFLSFLIYFFLSSLSFCLS